MKKKIIKIAIGIVAVVVILVVILFANNRIGLSSNKIESDIRSSQNIQEDWIIEGDVSDNVAAYIAYPDENGLCNFYVYVKHPGLSLGWFLRIGGDLASVDQGLVEFSLDGYSERAFISMNKQNIVKAEIGEGESAEIVTIEDGKPFAIVVPGNRMVTFYDADGNVVESSKERV